MGHRARLEYNRRQSQKKGPKHPHRRKDKGCEPLTVQRKCTDVAACHGLQHTLLELRVAELME